MKRHGESSFHKYCSLNYICCVLIGINSLSPGWCIKSFENFIWNDIFSSISSVKLHLFSFVDGHTVKCHYNACHYNANASLTRSILGSQTAPTCPHNHPQVAQHMDKRCEITAVWSATAAMTPLCSHTNGIKQRYPTCWLCQYSRFMIDLQSNTLIIHLRCSRMCRDACRDR